jgi:iron complex outermembrane receptor protein
MFSKTALLLVLISCSAFSQTPASAPSQPPVTPTIPPENQSIVVIGTFVPAPLSENDRSVESFPTRETPLLFDSVVDYLQFDPSIDLQERAPNGVQGDLTILGSTFAETLVLLDGLRINDAQTAHHDMDIPIPLEAISRIEVLHGAGSTFYAPMPWEAQSTSLRRQPAPPNFECGPPEATKDSISSTSSHHGCFATGRKPSLQIEISPQVSSLTVTIATTPLLRKQDSILLSDKLT